MLPLFLFFSPSENRLVLILSLTLNFVVYFFVYFVGRIGFDSTQPGGDAGSVGGKEVANLLQPEEGESRENKHRQQRNTALLLLPATHFSPKGIRSAECHVPEDNSCLSKNPFLLLCRRYVTFHAVTKINNTTGRENVENRNTFTEARLLHCFVTVGFQSRRNEFFLLAVPKSCTCCCCCFCRWKRRVMSSGI